jgi:hypothetical protein
MNRKKAFLMAALIMPMQGPVARVIKDGNDSPNVLSPGQNIEMNLKVIDVQSKRKVPQRYSPWSDVTWKANKGLISERYNDGNFEAIQGWSGMHQYLTQNSPDKILWMFPWERERWIASLSPAEKYDLVLGISDNGLAGNIGSFLDQTLGADPGFPSWWGLCEGSAPVSVLYPEPVRTVVLHSEAYNVDVPFYAPDIKGLVTMLWSRFNTTLNFPESDSACPSRDGKPCYDSNAASFHAAVHHFLDLSPGVLIGDMDTSPVVWNFPLVSYSESYFRPDLGTDARAHDLASAAIPVSQWPADPRRGTRSPGTSYIVGVKLNISYGVNQEKLPPLEGSLKRKINTRTLAYELELDSDFNMLGGEWIAGKHPSLLWSVPNGTVPDSPFESQLPSYGGDTGVVPKSWGDAARASAKKLTPLRRVVELLIDRSK